MANNRKKQLAKARNKAKAPGQRSVDVKPWERITTGMKRPSQLGFNGWTTGYNGSGRGTW